MELNTFISRLFEAAQAAGVAPAEAACSQSDSFQVRVRRGELEDYQVSERLSLTLRGQVNGRIGTASTQAVTEESIPLLIQGVLESAALIETDEQDAILPPDDSYSSVCNASQAVTAITAEQKIALARDIDAKLRSDDPRLTPDTCAVATGEETFTLKNTLGLDLSHHSNMIYAMADVVARDGEHAATNYEIRWGYGLDAIDAEELAESCKREALLKLEAGRMKSGAYPVVIKNTAMADLLATFCGVFSADNAQKGLSLLAAQDTAAQPQDRQKSRLPDDRQRGGRGARRADEPLFQTRKADAGGAARQPRRRPVSDRGIRPARGREPHQRRLLAALPRV